jgi:hypothetical protein
MTLRSDAFGDGFDAREPERPRPAEAAPVASAPSATPTAADLLDVLRDACCSLDPPHAGFYQHMSPEDVRDALRLNALLLEAARTYQHKYRIDRRGRRPFASALYRHLDTTPPAYTVVALAWASLTTSLLDPPDPEPAETPAAVPVLGRPAQSPDTPAYQPRARARVRAASADTVSAGRCVIPRHCELWSAARFP